MGIGVTRAGFCAFANFSRNEQALRMPTAWSGEMTKCQNSLADALTSKIHVTLHVRAVSQSLCGIPPALTKSSYAPSETGSVLSDEDDQKHAAIAAGIGSAFDPALGYFVISSFCQAAALWVGLVPPPNREFCHFVIPSGCHPRPLHIR